MAYNDNKPILSDLTPDVNMINIISGEIAEIVKEKFEDIKVLIVDCEEEFNSFIKAIFDIFAIQYESISLDSFNHKIIKTFLPDIVIKGHKETIIEHCEFCRRNQALKKDVNYYSVSFFEKEPDIKTIKRFMKLGIDEVIILPASEFQLITKIRSIANIIRKNKQLQATDRKIQNIFQNARLLIVQMDIRGDIVFCNDYLLNITGWKLKEVLKKNWFDLFIPGETQLKAIFLENIFSGEIPTHFENEIVGKNGDPRRVSWNNSIEYDAAGNVSGIISIGEDITDEVNAVEELDKIAAFNQTIIKSSTDCIMILDTEGRIQYISDGGLELLSIEDFQLFKGKRYVSLWKELDKPVFATALQNAINGGTGRFSGYCNNKWWDIILNPIYDAKKKITQLLAISRDITASVELSRKLTESEDKLKLIFENANLGIVLSNKDARLEYINPAFCNMLGYSAHELIGMHYKDFSVDDESAEKEYDLIVKLISGDISHYSIEKQYIHKNGSRFWVRGNISLYKKYGESAAFIGVVENIDQSMKQRDEISFTHKINSSISALYATLVSPFSNIRDIANHVLEEAKKLSGADHGYVGTIDPITRKLVSHTITRMFGDVCRIDDENKKIEFPVGEDGSYPTLWGHALNTLQGFYTNTPSEHKHSKGIPKGHIGIDNFLSVPVVLNKELVGQIALANKEGGFTDLDLQAMSRLAEIYALSVLRLRYEKQVIESEKMLSQVFNIATEAMRLIDRDKKIIRVNKLYANLNFNSIESILGKSCKNFLCSNNCKTETCIHDMIMKGQPFFRKELSYAVKGELRHFIVSAVPYQDENGETIGVLESYKDITDIKNNEQELQKFKLIADQNPINIAITKTDGTIEYVNEAFSKSTGYSEEELIENKPSALKSGHHPDSYYKELWTTVLKGKVWKGIFLNKKKSGDTYWERATIAPLKNEHGKIINLIGMKEDITEQVKAEQELAETEAKLRRFRFALDSSADAVYLIDRQQMRFIDANQTGFSTLGYTFKELMSLGPQDIKPFDSRKKLEELFDKIIFSNTRETMETFHKHKNGTNIPVEINLQAMPYKDNYLIIAIARDISYRKKAEAALYVRDEAIESATSAIAMADLNGFITYTNKSFLKLLDVDSKDVIIGKSIVEFASDKDHFSRVMALISKNNTYSGEGKLIKADNSDLDVYMNINNVIDNAGNKVMIMASFSDISTLKETQKELTTYKEHLEKLVEQRTHELSMSEEKFRNIFNSSFDSIFITDLNGNFKEFNRSFMKRMSTTRNYLAKMNIATLPFIVYDPAKIRTYIHQLVINGEHIIEFEYKTRDEQYHYEEIAGKLIRYEGEEVILHISRDVTLRKEMENKILETIMKTEEKERERFAKDLHDGLGPLLSTIKLYVDSLASDDYSDHQKQEMILNADSVIEKAINSTREIAQGLMPNVLDYFGIVKALSNIIEDINNTGKLTVVFDHKNFTIQAEKNTEIIIYRVCEELINNSLKHAKASVINLKLQNNGNQIDLTFVDNGIGFNVDDMLNIQSGNLGLKNIRNRINAVGGRVDFSSKAGKGMQCSVSIPLKK